MFFLSQSHSEGTFPKRVDSQGKGTIKVKEKSGRDAARTQPGIYHLWK